MNITAQTKICMVIGDPIGHSLSPAMHNAGYEALGIDAQFVYVASKVKIQSLEDFIRGVRAMNILGISCTMPHKLKIMKYLDRIDSVAEKIGAVNTILNENGILVGYNTDWIGAVEPIAVRTKLHGKKVALIGAGGAARAIAFGITKHEGILTIFNRTKEKADQLAEEFGAQSEDWEQILKVNDMDIIINATSIGMHPHEDESPLPKELITRNHIVFDAIYSPYETKLLRDAKENGATVIHGLEMLLYQGVAQFKLFTNQEAPIDKMKEVLLLKT